MSHNLTLASASGDEFSLVQTPTDVTRAALASGGHAGAVLAYGRWLRGARWRLDPDDAELYDWAPGWGPDPIERHLAQVDAFLAFAPGARFGST